MDINRNVLDSKPYEYSFEIETILQQFIAIIDNCSIMRYDKNENGERILKNIIKPSYIMAVKQRIFYDIINKAKNHILPVIAISLKSITYDKERQASKNQLITVSSEDLDTSYERPTPIKITVDVSIISKYMTDLYQIYGKIITQFQPYVTFSWFVPQNIKGNYVELRNKIECEGNLNLDFKQEIKDEEDKFVGTLSFTIDGWMFPTMNGCTEGIIYDIGTTLIVNEDVLNRTYTEIGSARTLVYSAMKDETWEKYNNPREFANAHPLITSIFLDSNINAGNVSKQAYFLIDKARAKENKIFKKSKLIINGYNLKEAKVLAKLKSSDIKGAIFYSEKYNNNLFPYPNEKEEKPNEISGFLLNTVSKTDNQIIVKFDNLNALNGEFDIIVLNKIDYDSMEKRKGFKLIGAI